MRNWLFKIEFSIFLTGVDCFIKTHIELKNETFCDPHCAACAVDLYKKYIYGCMAVSVADGGEGTGTVAPGPQCKGAPKQCRTPIWFISLYTWLHGSISTYSDGTFFFLVSNMCIQGNVDDGM